MPEGDTILRTARRLSEVLMGQRVTEARTREPGFDARSLLDHEVQTVEARGKHLLIHFEDRRTLHSHMGMTGSWHVYQPGESWQKPERRAAVVLELSRVVAVCFSPKTLELLTATGLRRHPYLQRLGPDILARLPDPDETLRRFRVHNARPVGEAIMNQSIICGIGNVYKSETLFAAGISPLTPVGQLSDQQILDLIKLARRLMLKNLDGYPRRTRFAKDGDRKWVYGRHGQSCFKCGQRIQMQRQGDLGRSTYWCTTCQP